MSYELVCETCGLRLFMTCCTHLGDNRCCDRPFVIRESHETTEAERNRYWEDCQRYEPRLAD